MNPAGVTYYTAVTSGLKKFSLYLLERIFNTKLMSFLCWGRREGESKRIDSYGMHVIVGGQVRRAP